MHLEDVSLKYTLTDAEITALAREQVAAIGKVGTCEQELDSIKKDYAGRIAIAKAEVQTCCQAINTGWEMRNIKCLLIDERPEGYRLVVRTDNGHVAKRRKLDPSERQMNLREQVGAAHRTLVGSALLKVDDPDFKDHDNIQVPFYQDEMDMLRDVQPPIQFMAGPGRHRQLEAPAEEKRGRGRPPKGNK